MFELIVLFASVFAGSISVFPFDQSDDQDDESKSVSATNAQSFDDYSGDSVHTTDVEDVDKTDSYIADTLIWPEADLPNLNLGARDSVTTPSIDIIDGGSVPGDNHDAANHDMPNEPVDAVALGTALLPAIEDLVGSDVLINYFDDIDEFYAAQDRLTPSERAYWADHFNVPGPVDQSDDDTLPPPDVTIDVEGNTSDESLIAFVLPFENADATEGHRYNWSEENINAAFSHLVMPGYGLEFGHFDENNNWVPDENPDYSSIFNNDQDMSAAEKIVWAKLYGIRIPNDDGLPYVNGHVNDPLQHLEVRDEVLSDVGAYYDRSFHADPELRLTFHERIAWAIHFGVPMLPYEGAFSDEYIQGLINQ